MALNINSRLNKRYNQKHIYYLMENVHISVICKKKKCYVMAQPRITAVNVINRKSKAETPNLKWLSDVTEYKLDGGKKAYLCAILVYTARTSCHIRRDT